MIRKFLVTVDIDSIGIDRPVKDLQLIIDFDFNGYDANVDMKKALNLEIKKQYEMWRYNMIYSTDDVTIDCKIKDWIAVPQFRSYLLRRRRKKTDSDETATD